MPLEEQNAPGFHYLVRWRNHDSKSMSPYNEQTVDSSSSSLIVDVHDIYQPYEIYVLAINEVGDAVSPPKMLIGYSAEDGTWNLISLIITIN